MLTNIILLHIYILYKTVFFFFFRSAQFNIVCALYAHLTVTIGIAKRCFVSVWRIIIRHTSILWGFNLTWDVARRAVALTRCQRPPVTAVTDQLWDLIVCSNEKKNSSIDTIAISKSTSLFFCYFRCLTSEHFTRKQRPWRYYTGTVLSVLTADNTTQNTRKSSGSFGGSREPAM